MFTCSHVHMFTCSHCSLTPTLTVCGATLLQERNSTAEAFAQSIVEYATTAWAVRLAGWRMSAVCVRVCVCVCVCVCMQMGQIPEIVFCVYISLTALNYPPSPLSGLLFMP